MATAPLKTQNLSIIPLADADLTSLERLFDEQCEEWLELLSWDYTGPSRLIREVARIGELSGYVALSGERPVGFIYYVFEENRCSIGEIFVSKEWRNTGVDRELAEAVLRKLDSTPRIRRIESQGISVGNEEAHAVFEARGFQRFDRCYMAIQAESYLLGVRPRPQDELPAMSSAILIRPWRDTDYSQAVRIIHSSYENSVDSRINNQYTSEEGCADLLTILTEHVWCGSFLRHVSQVAVDSIQETRVGVLMASRISPGVGHISQISVRSALHGKGIGRQLIYSALNEFFYMGFKQVSLAVTSANWKALRLYEACGFRTLHSFPVFYLDR